MPCRVISCLNRVKVTGKIGDINEWDYLTRLEFEIGLSLLKFSLYFLQIHFSVNFEHSLQLDNLVIVVCKLFSFVFKLFSFVWICFGRFKSRRLIIRYFYSFPQEIEEYH